MLVLAPMFAMWSVTTAMFGSPDETVHMIRAQSFAVLDFRAPYTTDGIPIESVECYRFLPDATAACQDLTWGEPGTQRRISTGGYPPVFHVIAAVPATVTSGLTGVYAMRLWMALVVAAGFAWAAAVAARPGNGPWPLIGVLLAINPMVAFTAGTVSPTGLAAAGTALFAVSLLTIVRDDRWDRATVAAAAVGLVAVIGTRRDGVIWLFVILVTFAPLFGIGDRWRSLRSSRVAARSVAPFAIALGVVALAALLFARPTIARFFGNWRDGQGGDPLEVARFIQVAIVDLIGRLGWLDTLIGSEATMTVIAVVGFVVIAAMVTAPPRHALATGLAFAALIVTPFLFGLVRFPYLQGRYLVPIWVALLVVAAWSLAHGELSARAARRAAPLLLLPWLIVHLASLVVNLRRYAVGRNGPWNVVTDPEWSPPMMSNGVALVLIALAGVAAAVGTVALLRAIEPATSQDVEAST